MVVKPVVPSGRDIRLDLFRGLALWFIFLDHVPTVMNWLTVRNYGFSDATEIFVFISGYTAVIAYSGMMLREGWLRAAARIWRRVWQLYVAHILLFVVYTAEIAYVSIATDTSSVIEEFAMMGLGENPFQAMMQAALLNFRPANLDVLPLYILLLAVFPFVLPAIIRWPLAVIAASLALYIPTLHYDWNLTAYPPDKGVWFFNPLAWQIVFHIGAACAVLGPRLKSLDRFRTTLTVLAVIYLLFGFLMTMSFEFNALAERIPPWVNRLIYPMDKTNIAPMRVVHFLAFAWLVRVLVPFNAPFLQWRILEPVRRCGEHSLLIFCIGTFLALTAQTAIRYFEESILSQIVVSTAGIVAMCVAAYVATWFKSGGSAGPGRSAAEVAT
jgi:hypothetical protein